jgi:hypothetical protein
MYENEVYDDNSTMVLSEVDDMSTSISITSNAKRHLKMLEELKKADVGYNKTYRFVSKKRVPIEFYTTNMTPGNKIRNAITGVHQNGLFVGSRSEDLFYKLSNTCDNCKNDQHILFFDSPEQYERHFHTTVPQEEKEIWLKKFTKEQIARS